MKSKTYDVLKYIAQIVLPALATLYVTLANIWEGVLPYPEAISGSIMAVDFFLGTLLKISSDEYFKTREIIDKVAPDTEEE